MNLAEDIIEYGLAANKIKAQLEEEMVKLRQINEALSREIETLNKELKTYR